MSTATEYPSALAVARFVRVSPTKARRVIDLVRGKSVAEALDILRWAPQAASEPVAKVIASAAANAQNNNGLDPSTLVVATVYADGGPTAKRIRPRAQGRAFRIRRAHQPHHGDRGKPAEQGRAGLAVPVRERDPRTSRSGQQGCGYGTCQEGVRRQGPGQEGYGRESYGQEGNGRKSAGQEGNGRESAGQESVPQKDI